MKELNEKKIALTLGLFLGGWHLIWSLLIVLGLAQPLLNFIFWAHMITNPYQVTGFVLTQSLILIAVTFTVGYIGGLVFAKISNKVHKK